MFNSVKKPTLVAVETVSEAAVVAVTSGEASAAAAVVRRPPALGLPNRPEEDKADHLISTVVKKD